MPITLYKLADKSPAVADEGEVLQLLHSGQFGVPTAQMFNLVDSEGNVSGIAGEHLQRALESGYRFETRTEEHSRFYAEKAEQESGSALRAGVARGLTLGLSDLALTKVGAVDPEYLSQLRAKNPLLTIAGEVGGAALGALLPSSPAGTVASGAAKAGATASESLSLIKALLPSGATAMLGQRVEGLALKALTGEVVGGSLASRALAKGAALAAAGAVEGSLWGVGQAVTESALGDPREAGELLAASVGPSALIGGIAGGIFGSAATLGGAAFRRLAAKAEEGIVSSVDKLAPAYRTEKAFEAIGLTRAKAVRALGGGEAGERKALAGVDTLLDPSILDDGAILQAGASTEEILKRGKAALNRYGGNIDAIVNSLDERASAIGRDVLPSKARISEQIDSLIAKEYAGKYAYRSGERELRRVQSTMAEDAAPYWGFSEAQSQKVAYGSAFKKRDVIHGDKYDAWRKVYGLISDELDNSAESLLTKTGETELLNELKNSRQIYSSLRDLMQAAGKQAAEASDDYVRRLAEGGQGFIKGLTWRMIYSGRGVASAARMSGIGLGVREGARIAGEFMRPSRVAVMADNAAKLRSIQKRVEQYAATVGGIIDAFFDTKKATKYMLPAIDVLHELTGERDQVAALNTYRQEIQSLASSPERLQERVAMSLDGLARAAPNVSASASATLVRAIETIASAIPPPDDGPTLQPELERYTPTQNALASARAVITAALRPEAVLNDALHGAVSAQSVDAVQAVYPGMIDMWRRAIATKAAETKDKLSYSKRVQLAIFMGTPTDKTLTPAFIHRSQLTWAPDENVAEAKTGSPPRLTPEAERKIFDRRTFQTTSQRLESGGKA